MKKLLAILAVSTLTVTSASLLVSCTTGLQRQDKLQYDFDTLRKIIFEITGEDIKMNLGDYLSESEVNEVIQSTLDSTLGLQSAFEDTNSNLKLLKTSDDDKVFVEYEKAADFKDASYDLQANSIAQKKLFKEYTTSLSNNESFDFQKLMDGFGLNVINDISVKDFSGNPIDVKSGDQVWFKNETDEEVLWITSVEIPNGSEVESNIPTIQTLTKEFEVDNRGAQFVIKSEDGAKRGEVSAQTALSLRFQDYFENQLKADIVSDVMVMSHMNTNMFRFRGTDAYIDPTNSFTKKLQDFNNSSEWKTNVRMVWTIKYKKFATAADNDKFWNEINTQNQELKNKENPATILEAVNKLNSLITPENLILDDSSYDSYFGLSGYQGIKFDGFGEDPTSGKSWADKVNSQQDGPKIISNTSTQPGFDVENPNYNEIAVVLPVYFIELMAGAKSKPEVGYADATSVYSLSDGAGNSKNIKLGRAGQTGDKEDILSTWSNKHVNTKGSTDVRATLSENSNRDNFINELLYMACTDATFVDAAKRDIYSRYLDKEQIYYSGIWDMVKKYIDDEEDEDM
ncbi:lipoprotein [Spiroplasma endosymbiont of Othius punctulatus]|uniref:lipoprotein n=1 Tax=Spiroplasma endosymbiont of Othius punctulatus TaxID=3066289 RepID=UPI0030D2CD0F